jgi:hypothetical protein
VTIANAIPASAGIATNARRVSRHAKTAAPQVEGIAAMV